MKKINLLVVALVLLVLSGCEVGYEPMVFPVLPPELKDCQFYRVDNKTNILKIVRCPNSTTSTTYKQGKSTQTTIVIDGEEYIKK